MEKKWKATEMDGIVNDFDRIVFLLLYPDGLTIQEMQVSGEGWLERMAADLQRTVSP